MKRLYILISFLCLIGAATAQNSNQNYVVTRTMLNESSSSYLDVVKYYDGLGRLCQTVHNQVTPQKNNLLDLSEYDESGRDVKDWLPVYSSSAYLSASAFSSTASGNYGSTARPFNQSVYEASPSDRLVAQYGPGSEWSDRPMTTDYMLNGSSEALNCVHYSVNGTTLVNGGSYATGELYVVRTQDEDGNTASQFTDKQGHTVLVSQLNGTVRHDTYYVYDDYGNLCYVLPPAMDGNISMANLNLYAYQYKYDRRNRCVWKKLPGADAVSYVYDLNDRLVFSQDGNQKSRGKWMFYLYDDLSRLVVQGECVNTNTSTASARYVACTRVNTATGLGNSGYSSDFALTAPVVYLVNYYDNYDFRTLPGFNNSFFSAETVSAKGSLSGSVVTVLGTDTKLYSANYYDKKGRVTKTVSSNLLSGYETTTTIYTFTGKPANVKHVHMAAGKTTQMEIYTYTYDHAERLTKVEHSLNGVKVTLAANTYDELGRLSSKSLHGSASNKLAYTYNIRNWIESISSGGLFNISLDYGYNGNVSRMVCRCPGDNKTYGYDFAYDNLSRLTSAGSLIGGAITLGYTTNYSYDKNGNLLHLRRGGQTGLGTKIIDNLSFTLNGNQLKAVNDDATATASNGFEFKDGAKLTTEYTYDANGSLIKDLNKGIEIQYNLLNLPSQVKFSDGSTITYTYGADGVKLRTVHRIGGVTTTTDYCDNVIYENGTAKQLLTEEGYVSLSDKKYHYYLKDHQGNNRLVTDQTGGMEEANYYYSFGGVFLSNGNDVQAYKYNGKELDTKKGLNWYDYGAREYDAVLGRFTTMDPSSESYYSTSPYAYCGNNPVNRIDPTGADWYENKDGNLYWQEGHGELEGYTRLGTSVSIQLGKNSYLNAYQNAGVIANQAVSAFDLIAMSPKLQNQFLGDNSPLSETSKSELFNGLIGREMDAIARPIGEFLVWNGAGELAGPLIGKTVSWAWGQFAGLFAGKGYESFSAFKKAYGAAGQGMAWHHIVEQNADNIAKFGAEKIHNTKNLIKLPHGKGSVHAGISGYYSSKMPGQDMIVRDYVKTLSYAEQYKFGIETLKRFGWKP